MRYTSDGGRFEVTGRRRISLRRRGHVPRQRRSPLDGADQLTTIAGQVEQLTEQLAERRLRAALEGEPARRAADTAERAANPAETSAALANIDPALGAVGDTLVGQLDAYTALPGTAGPVSGGSPVHSRADRSTEVAGPTTPTPLTPAARRHVNPRRPSRIGPTKQTEPERYRPRKEPECSHSCAADPKRPPTTAEPQTEEQTSADRERVNTFAADFTASPFVEPDDDEHQLWKAGKLVPWYITHLLDSGNHAGPAVDIACKAREPAVDRWEVGSEYPSWEQTVALARLLGVRVRVLTHPDARPRHHENRPPRRIAGMAILSFEPAAVQAVTGTVPAG